MASAISRDLRKLSPAHYILTIKSFPKLAKAGANKYKSGVFEVKDYNWRLILYPNGKKESNGYISLYLKLLKSSKSDGPVSVVFTFFVYDYKKKQYWAIEYDKGAERCFHKEKREWGIDQLLSLKAFKEPFNGYLDDDSCEFGVEIFVIESKAKWEALSVVELPRDEKILKYNLTDFSNSKDSEYCSREHTAGGRKWRIVICPKGDGTAKGYLSIYLRLLDSDNFFQSKKKLYAKYKMRVIDITRKKIDEETSSCWFSNEVQDCGYPYFMPLEVLDSEKYTASDTLRVEVEFLVISDVKVE